MSEITFSKAVLRDARQIISFIGPSGSGKTLSALKFTRGLIGPKGNLCVVDTERGRSTFYSDQVEFDVAHFNPPFTPARYIQFIDAAERAGYDACLIDSGSHEWDGIGGCKEMKEKSTLSSDWSKWAYPKAENKKFVNRIVSSGMHIIICLRALEKTRQIDDPDKPGKKIIVNDGFVPICERNLPYELVVSIMMLPRLPGETVGKRQILKCPERFQHIFDTNDWISEANGESLAKILAGVETTYSGASALRVAGEEASLQGMSVFKRWFNGLSQDERLSIVNELPGFKNAASSVDKENSRIKDEASHESV